MGEREHGPSATTLCVMDDERTAQLRALLAAQVIETAQRIVDLDAELASIVEASDRANIDDEHDPEGATIAFERAMVITLLDTARSSLVELDQATASLDSGTFGRCHACGATIPWERLEARPSTTTCVDCA